MSKAGILPAFFLDYSYSRAKAHGNHEYKIELFIVTSRKSH